MKRKIFTILMAVGVLAADVLLLPNAQALPFNTDMMSVQPSTGRIMRPKASGSIPEGAESRYVGTKEESASLVNPVSPTRLSVAKGSRLFHANCSPCHGRFIDGKHVQGYVQQFLPGPDLSLPIYKDKPDGHFFQFIHFGGMAIMPAYGAKFSINEHWDIVNYIRHVQSSVGSTASQTAGK